MNVLSRCLEWESGGLDEVEEVNLFQDLINTGMAYKLGQVYSQRANILILKGYCSPNWRN